MDKRTILLVDDHPLVRRGLRAMLDEYFAICGEAENGKEAIEMAQSLNPDLVLMDVSMPVLDGLEATRHIRTLLPKTKILILSMHEGAQIEASAKSAGAHGIISKTATTGDVIASIEKHLSH